MLSGNFPQHGSFSFRWTQGVGVLQMVGPWNIETFDAYYSHLKSRASVLPERWGAIVTIAGEALVPPEVVPQWRESNRFLASSGLAAVAYCFQDATCASLYEAVFRRALGDAPFEYAFVDDEPAALVWLAARNLTVV